SPAPRDLPSFPTRRSSDLLALRFRQALGGEPVAEEAGQRAAPLGVTADDPRGRLLQHRLGRAQFPGNGLRLQPAAVHLVERDQRSEERRVGKEYTTAPTAT